MPKTNSTKVRSSAKKCYYFGEFGYLNLVILGGLEQLILRDPSIKLEICTYTSYGKLLNYLFPENVLIKTVLWSFNDKYRLQHDYKDSKFRKYLEKRGYEYNLYEYIKKLPIHNKKVKRCFLNKIWTPEEDLKLFYLNSPLCYGIQGQKRYISIFPRSRSVDKFRNISKEVWNKLLEKLQRFDYLLVVHGTDSEFLNLKGPNLIYPKNILEQINFLNNSIFCLSPSSGVAQLAVNCKCPLIILDDQYSLFKDFNPFGEIIVSISPKKLLNNNLLFDLIKAAENGDLKSQKYESHRIYLHDQKTKINYYIMNTIKRHHNQLCFFISNNANRKYNEK